MSQRINVRLGDSRRGSTAFIAIIAVLLLVGAGVGGWWYYTTHMQGKNNPGKTKTAADSVKSYLDDLESKLKEVEKDPKAKEPIDGIKTLSEDDEITGLTKQVKDAPPEIKATIAPMILAKLKDLQPLIDKVMANPEVKAQLEPLITKIMMAIKGLGT